MERHAINDDRAARIATVRLELTDKLSSVRGDMSDEKFARTLSLLAQGLERAEYNATRHALSAEYDRLRHTSPGSG